MATAIINNNVNFTSNTTPPTTPDELKPLELRDRYSSLVHPHDDEDEGEEQEEEEKGHNETDHETEGDHSIGAESVVKQDDVLVDDATAASTPERVTAMDSDVEVSCGPAHDDDDDDDDDDAAAVPSSCSSSLSPRSLDNIEVLQRSASMDLTYALLKENLRKSRRSIRSRSMVGRRRPMSPLGSACALRGRGGDYDDDYHGGGDDDDDHQRELMALNRRWQAIMSDDRFQPQKPLPKTNSTLTKADDETIRVKNSAVIYTPSANPKSRDEEEEEEMENHDDDKHPHSQQVREPSSTENSTASSSEDVQVRPPHKIRLPKRRFFGMLANRREGRRWMPPEEKRFAEIKKGTGLFSNKKQNKKQHFSLSPFPTPPRAVQAATPQPRVRVTIEQLPNQLKQLDKGSVDEKKKSKKTLVATKDNSTGADEILRDLDSSQQTTPPRPTNTTGTSSSSSSAPTKEQIAAAIANPQTNLQRARKYRKKAKRLLHSVLVETGDDQQALANLTANPFSFLASTTCNQKDDDPQDRQDRAKKAYQYAAEARRLYDLVEATEPVAVNEQEKKESETRPKHSNSVDMEDSNHSSQRSQFALFKDESAKFSRDMSEYDRPMSPFAKRSTSGLSAISGEMSTSEATTFSERMAREEHRTKMKELALFSDLDVLAAKAKMSLACHDSDDMLGAMYAAEAQRLMRIIDEADSVLSSSDGGVGEEDDLSPMYASPVVSYEEMSVLTSATELRIREEHRARMAELKLFTAENIATSLQTSWQRLQRNMNLFRRKPEVIPEDAPNNPTTTTTTTTTTTPVVEPPEEGGFQYVNTCQFGADDTYTVLSASTRRTIYSESMESIEVDETSSGVVSQSLETVDEEESSVSCSSSGSSSRSDGSRSSGSSSSSSKSSSVTKSESSKGAAEDDDDDDESDGSITTYSEEEEDPELASMVSQSSTRSSRTDQSSQITGWTGKSSKTDHSEAKGFAAWIRRM